MSRIIQLQRRQKKTLPYFLATLKKESMTSMSLLLLLEFPFVQSDAGGINPKTLDTQEWFFEHPLTTPQKIHTSTV